MIKRAKQKLRELESLSLNATASHVETPQMNLLDTPEEAAPALDALAGINPIH